MPYVTKLYWGDDKLKRKFINLDKTNSNKEVTVSGEYSASVGEVIIRLNTLKKLLPVKCAGLFYRTFIFQEIMVYKIFGGGVYERVRSFKARV